MYLKYVLLLINVSHLPDTVCQAYELLCLVDVVLQGEVGDQAGQTLAISVSHLVSSTLSLILNTLYLVIL